jgi:beta-glucanase (GH16 family)
MTDFEFDIDSGNIVEVDSINLQVTTKPFNLTNGGFESDAADFGAGAPPAGWLQFPAEGVSKNLVANGTPVYSASLGAADENVPFAAYAGTKSAKIYAQNFYNNQGIWQGPQTGVVYQEWGVAGTAGLAAGQVLHARGVAKVYGIDPLTGGSTFRYGFRYMDASDVPVAPDDVTTITASTDVPDRWVPLVANGTVPAGAAKVQLIAEFVQNDASDAGAVYLDDLSVGFGSVPAVQNIGGTTYQLVWSDEFNGSSLNTANWTPEIGTGDNGWGNGEAQFYTDRPENLRVENGRLVIEARKENYSGSTWTSARIKTQDKRSFKYGKLEFRAKLPTGVGPWPAAWMLGTNLSTVGWPVCGEIDVMEWRGTGSDANTVGHALHSATRHGGNPVQPPTRSPVTNPSTEFHTYAVLWTSNSLTFSVDGVDMATLTPPAADAEAFRKEFFLLLNLAMGGVYNGYAIDPSLTRATYEVDYVRVYQDPFSNTETDTTPPAFTLNGANSVTNNWGSPYTDAGATAFDAGDNASVSVTTNNPVDPTVPGTYLVTYSAIDSKGNSALTNRSVVVAMANGGTNKGADGLSDIVRYAFGGTGTEPLSRSLMPSSSMTDTNGNKQLVLTYFARTNGNVTVVPVVSTNLSTANGWNTNGVTVTTLQTNVATNGMILHKRQAVTPATGAGKFLRLDATLAP